MKKLFKELNIDLTDQQEQQLNKYYELMVSENKKYNLTTITEYNEVLIKHFYDSLTLAKAINLNEVKTMCDIGSGAGFPGIPIKIVFPHLKIDLVESQIKKTNFLKLVIDSLDLKDIKVINIRAEDLAKTNSNHYDLVTARAVSALNILSELSIPLVKINGHFVAMKGISYKNELNDAKNGIITLGGEMKSIIDLNLPNDNGQRNLIVVEKKKHVKGYPRTYAQIKKKPL